MILKENIFFRKMFKVTEYAALTFYTTTQVQRFVYRYMLLYFFHYMSSNYVACATSKVSDPGSLIRAFASRMNIL